MMLADYISLSLEICIILSWMVISTAVLHILSVCVLFKDCISLWSLGREQSSDGQSAAQLGLAWLIPLWVDRDPEVRPSCGMHIMAIQ